MARIDFPERGLGEHADWALLRPEIGVAMGTLSSAVYEKSQLDVREREAARFTIAIINDCVVCQNTRAKRADEAGIDEGFYGQVTSWRTSTELTERERLAAEFAFRFALDHQNLDDDFWARLRGAFKDEEIADLTMCCGAWLGMGRMLAVLGVRAPEERLLV
jgi:alkylhydroperoxidase family enzyme